MTTRDLPTVKNGAFATSNFVYRECTQPDNPQREFEAFVRDLGDDGTHFRVSMSSDAERRAKELVGDPIDQERFDAALAVGIARVGSKLKKLPTGKANAIRVSLLDSDFVPGIGKSLRDLGGNS